VRSFPLNATDSTRKKLWRRNLVSGSEDKTIKVWDLATGACLVTFFAEIAVLCMAFSATNALAAGDLSGSVYLFEIRS